MFAAVTDHVFIDGGHTIDFTNKAFEALDHARHRTPRRDRAARRSCARRPPRAALGGVLRVAPPARPRRARRRTTTALPARSPTGVGAVDGFADVGGARVAAARRRSRRGRRRAARRDARPARPRSSSAARSRTRPRCASCASTCRTTTATGTRCTTRSPPPTRCTRRCRAQPHARAAARRACTRALRIYLDRFLNVPAARLPQATTGSIDALDRLLRRAGHGRRGRRNEAYGFLRGRRRRRPSSSPRSGTRCSSRTPSSTGSRRSRPACARRRRGPKDPRSRALILVGVARFLAAHTPTRRELPTVVRIAAAPPPRRSPLRGRLTLLVQLTL